MPKTKATLLLICHSKVRVASGVINCPLALRTVDAVLRVSRLGLLPAASGDALIADAFLYRETTVLENGAFRKWFLIQVYKIEVAIAKRCGAIATLAVLISEFRLLRSKFRVLRSEFQALKSEFRVLKSMFRVLKSEFQALRAMVQAQRSEFRVLRAKGEGWRAIAHLPANTAPTRKGIVPI